MRMALDLLHVDKYTPTWWLVPVSGIAATFVGKQICSCTCMSLLELTHNCAHSYLVSSNRGLYFYAYFHHANFDPASSLRRILFEGGLRVTMSALAWFFL